MKTFPLLLLFWDRKNGRGSKRYADITAESEAQAIAEARTIHPNAIQVMNLDRALEPARSKAEQLAML